MDSYQLDAKLVLSDGAAGYTANGISQVGGVNQILDLGGPQSRTDLGIIGGQAVMRFAVVIDITAIITTTNDDVYSIDIMGSNVAAGTNPVHLGGLKVGYGTLLPNGSHSAGGAAAGTGSDTSTGRFIIFATTEQNDVKYEFVYLYVTVAGTGKSITFKAFASMWPYE
jgi:hypothetical protein